MISSIAIAFKYSWSLTLVTSSILIFIALVYGTIIPVIIKMTKEVEHADGKASSIAGEVLGSIRMVVACGAEGRIAQRYSGWVQESKRRGLKMSPFVGVQFAPLFFSIYATMALCFWFGFKLYQQGHIDNVGDIVIVLMSVMMIAFSLSQTAGPIIAISKSVAAASDFMATIDAPKPVTTGLKGPDVSATDSISLDSVTFAYPSRPHVKVLDDLSIKIPSGKITAIVGASGSGKSTIVGLLERWYLLDETKLYALPKSVVKDEKAEIEKKFNTKAGEEETKVVEEEQPKVNLGGSISIGGHNLDTVDLKWWRQQIGLVQQEPFIFNDTIRKNVEYGLIGSEWENESPEKKQELVEEACKEAFADEYITRLPMVSRIRVLYYDCNFMHQHRISQFRQLLTSWQGYDTQVGDSGIKLSGGQRQRLAIARSIIKRPKILILDEATSSIDVRGERLVQAALDRVSEGRTTITIAHRLSTIKKADNIIVLKKGKLVEQGTHDSLLDNENGAYWALVNAQKLSMGEEFAAESDLIEELSTDPLVRATSTASGVAKAEEVESDWEPKGFFGSFGLLMREQTVLWKWYLILLVGCAGGASGYPIQAYIFAQLLNVFTYVGQALRDASNHWALMYFILAIGIAVAYFILGSSSNVVSTVRIIFHNTGLYADNNIEYCLYISPTVL
jgi:ATP-binding cassette subfamily B (MDR/TAP) protein 1